MWDDAMALGAILAVEVSRLERSSMDWQQLFFNPSDHDDRLLLDLKGTMSEAPLAVGREDGAQNLARLTIAVAPGP